MLTIRDRPNPNVKPDFSEETLQAQAVINAGKKNLPAYLINK